METTRKGKLDEEDILQIREVTEQKAKEDGGLHTTYIHTYTIGMRISTESKS